LEFNNRRVFFQTSSRMPPYSHTDRLTTNDDGTVIELEGKQIDNDVKEDSVAEGARDKPDADLTAAIPASRVRSFVESDGAKDPNTTGTRGMRARRKRVQSMPVGSQGAQNFFAARTAGHSKLDEIRESILSQENSTGFPTVKSKSTDALGKLYESLVENGSTEESRLISSEVAGKVSTPTLNEPKRIDAASTNKPAANSASSTPEGSGKGNSTENTASCQCIIL